jgi:hypothetical protein
VASEDNWVEAADTGRSEAPVAMQFKQGYSRSPVKEHLRRQSLQTPKER